MRMTLVTRRICTVLVAAALAVAGVASAPGTASATAANKMVAFGNTTLVECTAQGLNSNCSNGTLLKPTAILQGTIKTSSSVALQISASVECSLVTNVEILTSTTAAKNSSSATAAVTLWVTISNGAQGFMVPVAPGAPAANPPVPGSPEPYNGMVTFCNRALTLQTANFSTQATIDLLESTASANAFNWLTLPLNDATLAGSLSCSGGCTVTLWAAITGSITAGSNNAAMAAITNRTLIVEPVNVANTVQF